jgi:hypothetical protein
MWNYIDNYTIVRDKNGKKKTSKKKLTYLLQILPDSILVEFNGYS